MTVQHPASASSGERHGQLQFKHADLLSWLEAHPPSNSSSAQGHNATSYNSQIKKLQFMSSRERGVSKIPSQKHWTKWQTLPSTPL